MSETDEVKYEMDKAVKLLGYTELKREQVLAIRKFVEGNDVFVNLPTGFGKTLCYTCLPVLFNNGSVETSKYFRLPAPTAVLHTKQTDIFSH